MNRGYVLIAVLIFAGVGFVHSASAQLTAERTFSQSEYFPGIPIQVTIHITGEPDQPLTVVDTIPDGLEIHGKHSGVVSGNQISFESSITSTGVKNHVYYVMSHSGSQGDALFEGTVNGQVIGGETTLVQGTLEPLGIFQHHTDLGNPITPGNARYDSASQEYFIQGYWNQGGTGGAGGHVIYSEMNGDFSLEAKMQTENPINGGAYIGIMDYIETHTPYYIFYRNAKDTLLNELWVNTLGANNIYTLFAFLYHGHGTSLYCSVRKGQDRPSRG